MYTNTSNSQRLQGMDSNNSFHERREVVTTSTYQTNMQPGISGDGGLDYNLTYRALSFPEQIGFDDLVQRKEVLHHLLREFRDHDGSVVFQPLKKEEYSKRLLLLEQQIDGLMRQSFLYSGRGTDGAVRTLDYNALINQKENQVVHLEKKIAHLESKLRIKEQQEKEHFEQLQRRWKIIITKNEEIQRLRNSARSYADIGKPQPEIVNDLARSLIRKLQQVMQRGGSVIQLQSQVEGWIMGLPGDSQLKRKVRAGDEQWIQNKYRKYVGYLTTEAGSMLNSMTKMYTTQIDTLKSRGTPIQYDNRILQLVRTEIIPRNLMPTEQVLMSRQVQNYNTGSSSSVGSITNIVNSYATSSQYWNGVSKVVEVPVQDARTKALIYKLTTEMKRLTTMHPKLLQKMSPELVTYISQQIIDVIEVDELDKLVEIVVKEPQIVRTENVYAYSSEKSRKVEFHLRVLIKALLEEMQKIKIRSGLDLQIDEGVLGMIRQEIMEVIDVQDILKVFRVVPKIVEVEKVKEVIVEKIVHVPHSIAIQNRETDVVPVKSVQVVADTRNVPLYIQKPATLTHEKYVVAPEYHKQIAVSTTIQQNPYQVSIDVPKVRNSQKVVGLMQDNLKVVEIAGPQKIVALDKEVIKTLIEQKIVPIERVIQEIVEVPKIVEKVVTVIQEVPKIIEVEKIVQKLVVVKQYVESQRVQNYVVEKPVEVICYVQKIVPVDRIVEKIVTHPEIVEKIVPLIQKEDVIKTVEVIREVPMYQTEIKVIEKIVQVAGKDRMVEVAKPVDRIIEVALLQQKVRVETEYRKQPVIEREERIIRQPVHVEVPYIMNKDVIVEVDKHIVHYVTNEIPRDMIKQKIVPIQTVRQQLVPAPVVIQKIIEKIVEVPKVVQLQKIVEKIVVVPRVVQKIVEVEKIVQKIVDRIIYQTDVRPVQILQQVPIEVQKVQTIEIPKYIIQKEQIPQIIQKDRIIINETKSESVRVEMIEQPPRVAIQRRQVPFEIIVQKLIPLKVQENVYVELKEQIVVPIQIPIPTTLIEQKIVPVQSVIPVVHQIDRVRQVVREVKVEVPGRIETRDRVVQKLFVEKDVKVVRDQIPYYNEKVVSVDRFEQKIVPVERVIKQVMEVPYMMDKIVKQIVEIPRVQEIQRIVQVPIRTQQLVTVDRIVPKIVTLNKAFAQIVDKIHEFPRLAEEMVKINTQVERIVPQRHVETNVQQVEVFVQQAVVQEKMKEVEKFVNVINQSLKIAQRVIQKPTEPIIITEQKVLQVPVIIEKLAERIVVMPQIVQVLKYVHEITDNESLGVALHGDVAIEQSQYQRLGHSLNGQLTSLRSLLTDLRSSEYRGKVTVIDNFLKSFNKFITYPRIREVMTEKVVQSIVEKDKIVKVPVKSSDDERRGLASAVLIDKLLMEVRKLRQTNSNSQYKFDSQLVQIFGDQLEPVSSKYGNNYNQLLDEYSKTIFSRFNMYGTWTLDHQRMLKQFIDERFELANSVRRSNKDAIKYRQLYNGTVEKYNRQKFTNDEIKVKFADLDRSVKDILVNIIDIGMKHALEERLNILGQAIYGYASGADTITYKLNEMSGMDIERSNRYVREKDILIAELRVTIQNLKRELEKRHTEVQGQFIYGNCNIHSQIIGDMQAELNQLRRYREMYGSSKNIHTSTTKTIVQKTTNEADTSRLSSENARLNSEISRLKSELSRSKEEIQRITIQINTLREIEINHRGCTLKIRQLEQRLRTTIEENQRYQRDLYEMRSVKDSKPTIGSFSSPNRNNDIGEMSDSYGRNYMQYAGQNSQGSNSGIRSSRAQLYEKNVWRSGGNPQTGNSTSGAGGSGITGNLSMGGIGGGNYVSSGYNQQRSSNYLADSRGSGASSASGPGGSLRSELSSKSSKGGAVGYKYQETHQKEYSVKGSIAQSNDGFQQNYSKMEGSQKGSNDSKLFGTSSKQMKRDEEE